MRSSFDTRRFENYEGPTLLSVAAAVVGGAVIGAGASLASGSMQADAAKDAADASRDANAQQRADMAPWRAAGQQALNQIGDFMGTSGNTGAANYGMLNRPFTAADLKSNLAPNYDFQLQQGIGATTNAANAGGFGGNALKGINDYAQNYAANAYQQAFSNYTANQTNIYNRLSNLAGLGQTANQVTGQLGAQNTQNAGNFATSGAAAQAGALVGGANAVSNGVANWAAWNYLNPSSSGTVSGRISPGGDGGYADYYGG